jgi:hypothetical protein
MKKSRRSTSDLSCKWSIANDAAIGANRKKPLAKPIVLLFFSRSDLFGKPTTKNNAANHQAVVKNNIGARITGLIAKRKAQAKTIRT